MPSNQGSLMFLPESPLGLPGLNFFYTRYKWGGKKEMVLLTGIIGINGLMEILMMILILMQLLHVLASSDLWTTPDGKNINYREHKNRTLKVPLLIKSTVIPILSFTPVSSFPANS